MSLENAEAVNALYAQKRPNRPLMRFFHLAMAGAFPVNTYFEAGARQAIEEHMGQNKQVFIAANHQHFVDPLVLCSILQREPVFRPMRTRTLAPGKASLFNHPLYGTVVRNSGAIPTFRPNEVDPNAGEVEKALLETRRRKAGDSLVNIMVAGLNSGLHAVIYPEGSRHRYGSRPESDNGTAQTERRDVTKLLALKPGIGRIALGVEHPEDLLIVCIGTIYGKSHEDYRHPTSVVAMPFQVPDTIGEVIDMTTRTLQWSVDSANRLAAAYNG